MRYVSSNHTKSNCAVQHEHKRGSGRVALAAGRGQFQIVAECRHEIGPGAVPLSFVSSHVFEQPANSIQLENSSQSKPGDDQCQQHQQQQSNNSSLSKVTKYIEYTYFFLSFFHKNLGQTKKCVLFRRLILFLSLFTEHICCVSQ
jgi:hypothetical protein